MVNCQSFELTALRQETVLGLSAHMPSPERSNHSEQSLIVRTAGQSINAQYRLLPSQTNCGGIYNINSHRRRSHVRITKKEIKETPYCRSAGAAAMDKLTVGPHWPEYRWSSQQMQQTRQLNGLRKIVFSVKSWL